MALTFTSKIENAIRTWKQQGLVEAHVEMTTTLGTTTAGSDYGTLGFDITGNAAKLGFRKIFTVAAVYLRSSADVPNPLLAHFDAITGRLRFFITSTNAEVVNNTATIGTNAKCRFVVLGV